MTSLYIDGQKSILLENYKPESWNWLGGVPDKGTDATAAEYFGTVPWLYRGVNLRANAVATIPFDLINERGDVIDSTDDWQNIVECIPNPYKMFWLLEASSVLTGTAYQFRVSNTVKTFELKYVRPISITPKLDEEKGLIGFERNTGTKQKLYPHNPNSPLTNKIIYYWLDDPNVELGEPESYPARAALCASGVLFNIDEFLNAFIKRGMVKPTLIGLKGNPPKEERDKTEAWFNKYLTGIKNAFRVKTISADAVDVTTIGEGLAELGSTELTMEKREDISTALGIPQTLLFSSGAGGLGGGGVVEQDDIRLYRDTAIPAWQGHAYALNQQYMIPRGYRLVERHEKMDLFQQDEKDSSAAVVNLTSALANDPRAFLVSSMILGNDIPDEAQAMLNKMIEQKEEDRKRMEEMAGAQPFGGQQPGQAQPPKNNAAELRPKRDPEEKRLIEKDLRTWCGRAKKDLERNKDIDRPFVSDYIPAAMCREIMSMLAEAKTVADINAVFDAAKDEQDAYNGDFADLITALGEATKALREKGSENGE